MSVGVFFCDGGEVAERRWVGGAWVVSAAICTRGILIRGAPSPVEVGCENSRTQVVAETEAPCACLRCLRGSQLPFSFCAVMREQMRPVPSRGGGCAV